MGSPLKGKGLEVRGHCEWFDVTKTPEEVRLKGKPDPGSKAWCICQEVWVRI